MRAIFLLLALLVATLSACVPPDSKDLISDSKNSLGHELDATIRYYVSTPSGAPPTNDGFAYSQGAYNEDWLFIAGQNGYDSNGCLAPIDVDAPGVYSIRTRTYMALLNVLDQIECFNLVLPQIPLNLVQMSDFLYREGFDTVERNDRFLRWRSQINTIQRLPEFWGPTAKVPARNIVAVDWLSRGDTTEFVPYPVPRDNKHCKTCLETGKPTNAAKILLAWTLNGTLPTHAIQLTPLVPC